MTSENGHALQGGATGGEIRMVRASGRWHLRQLERIEKTGGYPTDEQVRTAVTTAEFLLTSKHERAQALGAALILKARQNATRRGMSILALAEDVRQANNGLKGTQTTDIRILAVDARGIARTAGPDDIRALMAPAEVARETVGGVHEQSPQPNGDGGAAGRQDPS